MKQPLTAETLTAAYSVELCPIALRGVATSFISLAWGTGSFIASGVVKGSLDIHSESHDTGI